MDSIVSFSQVSKKYDQKYALKQVSFVLPSSGVVGLLGPNGAGKSTTMKLMVGLLQASTGSVLVGGKNPTSNKIATNNMIGYLGESNALYKNMLVGEYLHFAADVKRAKNVQEVCSQVGVENVLNKKIESLSRGYCQRVGLACALLGEPQILVLDEPTAGLDPVEQEKIRSLIIKIAKNRLVLISSHILSEIEEVAQNLLIIHEGQIVFDGPKPKGKGEVEKLFMKKIISHSS